MAIVININLESGVFVPVRYQQVNTGKGAISIKVTSLLKHRVDYRSNMSLMSTR